MPRIGLISDTHGLLRPAAKTWLAGCDHIIHAGDIGHQDVIDQLSTIAPVTTVRGNNDKGGWAACIPETEVVQIDDVFFYVLHDLAELEIDPATAGFQVVVSGHSHQPNIREHNGVVYINPGSAGPRRFKLPIALAEVEVSGHKLKYFWTELGA